MASTTPRCSVRRPGLAPAAQRFGVPFEFVEEPADTLLNNRLLGAAIVVEGVLHMRNREDRGDARHAELSQGHAQLHRRAYAAKSASRIGNNGRGPEEIFLEEMIKQEGFCTSVR